jgi:hypothetical protein
MVLVRPETLVRWHRAGLRRYWRRKSRPAGGRPPISAELRALIWQMSLENRLWGAPHIHGELLKLGYAVAQSTRNHMPHIATMDLFVVPTVSFNLALRPGHLFGCPGVSLCGSM